MNHEGTKSTTKKEWKAEWVFARRWSNLLACQRVVVDDQKAPGTRHQGIELVDVLRLLVVIT